MIATEEHQKIAKGIRKVAKIVHALEGSQGTLRLYGPSRHIVLTSGSGTLVAKSYTDSEHQKADDRRREELSTLVKLSDINEARVSKLQGIGINDHPYMGLPRIDNRIDTSGIDTVQNGTPFSIFAAAQGELLYDRARNGTATFHDYLQASVNAARITEELKHDSRRDAKDRIKLEDVVRDRKPDTDWFVNVRFLGVFLDQLSRYAGINFSESVREDMKRDWEILVANPLVKTHRDGYAAFYYDCSPRHHVLNPSTGAIVSFDFEQRLYVPALLGLASLVSFGLGEDKTPHLSNENITRILDRYLLEIAFVDAMRRGWEDKPKRIAEFLAERNGAFGYDLSTGQQSAEFYRFIGDNDTGRGEERRREFLSPWRYALIDRAVAWIGHKARYRAVTESLIEEGMIREEGIKFEPEDPIRQNALEQRQHWAVTLRTLDELQGILSRNGNERAYAADAARRLKDRFQEIAVNPYFSLK